MKYLADTDIIINHLRGKKRIDNTKISAGIGISIISYGELLYGAEKASNHQKTRKIITNFIDELSIKIIDLNEKTMKSYAKLKVGLEKKGSRLDDFDLLIAATAKTNSLILLTGNLKHFTRIKTLSVEK